MVLPPSRSAVLVASWSAESARIDPLISKALPVKTLGNHAQECCRALYAKNNVRDVPHFIEPLCIQILGHLELDRFPPPGDLEGEACRSDLDLNLTLNKKIGE